MGSKVWLEEVHQSVRSMNGLQADIIVKLGSEETGMLWRKQGTGATRVI